LPGRRSQVDDGPEHHEFRVPKEAVTNPVHEAGMLDAI
jgi:hypothetical protein